MSSRKTSGPKVWLWTATRDNEDFDEALPSIVGGKAKSGYCSHRIPHNLEQLSVSAVRILSDAVSGRCSTRNTLGIRFILKRCECAEPLSTSWVTVLRTEHSRRTVKQAFWSSSNPATRDPSSICQYQQVRPYERVTAQITKHCSPLGSRRPGQCLVIFGVPAFRELLTKSPIFTFDEAWLAPDSVPSGSSGS
jgi:hypothetical protein